MKKPSFIIAMIALTSCSSSISSIATQDSSVNTIDTAINSERAAVDSAAAAQRARIDSINRQAGNDSAAKTKKDTTKN